MSIQFISADGKPRGSLPASPHFLHIIHRKLNNWEFSVSETLHGVITLIWKKLPFVNPFGFLSALPHPSLISSSPLQLWFICSKPSKQEQGWFFFFSYLSFILYGCLENHSQSICLQCLGILDTTWDVSVKTVSYWAWVNLFVVLFGLFKDYYWPIRKGAYSYLHENPHMVRKQVGFYKYAHRQTRYCACHTKN